MREIKFQGWDGETLRDLSPTELAFYLNAGLSVQQYTGLKDKNGKEIYEGDILELDFILTTEKLVVKYLDNIGAFNIHEKRNWNSGMGGSMYVNIEVIGNIYENPELLEDK